MNKWWQNLTYGIILFSIYFKININIQQIYLLKYISKCIYTNIKFENLNKKNILFFFCAKIRFKMYLYKYKKNIFAKIRFKIYVNIFSTNIFWDIFCIFLKIKMLYMYKYIFRKNIFWPLYISVKENAFTLYLNSHSQTKKGSFHHYTNLEAKVYWFYLPLAQWTIELQPF